MPFLPRILEFGNSLTNDEEADSADEPSTLLEYRIRLPMTVEEHEIARLYAISRTSKTETGGGEGIEYIENRPFTRSDDDDADNIPEGFDSGQYTRKKIHLSEKVPLFVRYLVPRDYLDVDEFSWNAYPHCKTDVKNEFLNDDFMYIIETYHFNNDDGTRENVFNLSPELLERRELMHIDIADNSLIDSQDYVAEEDPSKYESEKTDRGPLAEGWESSCETMCVYKLVSIKFKWWGLQSRAEDILKRVTTRIFLSFFRRLYCWTDEWADMTMEQIRKLEEETKKELDQIRHNGTVQGFAGQE